MCDYTQTAWSTGIIIGRYILVLPLHYKYDGLHSCRSKECVGPGVEASCRVQDVSSSGLTAVDHTPAADAPSTRRSLQVCWRVFGECKCSRVSLEISPNHLGEERPGEDGRRIPELNLREGGGLGPVAQALFASWRTRMATRTVSSDWWFWWNV